ncbi:MAG: peroxiredoxin [Aigarchaeota archaeon]|nr:peroxiredoxin [Candidatus Pelearchaeum maunauluense]
MNRVKVGDLAPDFTLPSHDGGVVRLSSLRGHHVVLFFYPKDGSPGCTRENCLVRDRLDEFKELDAVVIGISKDSLDKHKRFAERYKLTHLLLSDADGEVSRRYGALGFLGLFTRRITFVIDRNGVIRYIHQSINPASHVEAALKALREITS